MILPARTLPDSEGRPQFVARDPLPKVRGEIARYVYRQAGEPVRLVLAFDDGRTGSLYRVTDGDVIGWQNARPVAGFDDVPYVAHNVADPFTPSAPEQWLCWPEREADVDLLARIAAPAFAFSLSAGSVVSAPYLAQRHVVIIAENRPTSRADADQKVACAIASGARSVRILHFPDFPERAGVADFIIAGGTLDELRIRIDEAPIQRPVAHICESRPAVGRAVAFLQGALADGPLTSKEIRKRAIAVGFSWATIKRAKGRGQIAHFRKGGMAASGCFYWSHKGETSTNTYPAPLSQKADGQMTKESAE